MWRGGRYRTAIQFGRRFFYARNSPRTTKKPRLIAGVSLKWESAAYFADGASAFGSTLGASSTFAAGVSGGNFDSSSGWFVKMTASGSLR
jgi:hypothetical protein